MALDPITAGIGLVDTFIGKFVKDKDLAAKLMHEARSEEFQGSLQVQMGQISVNLEEAKSESLFKSGWRPAVGWVCVLAMGYTFVLSPFMRFFALLLIETPPTFPVLSFGELMPVLMGMLGLGALRTYEKTQGIAAK